METVLEKGFFIDLMNLYSNCNSEIGLKIGGVNLASRYSKSIQYSDTDAHDERSPASFLR